MNYLVSQTVAFLAAVETEPVSSVAVSVNIYLTYWIIWDSRCVSSKLITFKLNFVIRAFTPIQLHFILIVNLFQQ